MAGKDNLIPQNMRTKEEQREIATLGGIASGKARREKKRLREFLDLALSKEITNSAGETATIGEVAMIQLATQMAEGDLKAIHLGANILGELKQEVSAEVKGMSIVVADQETANDLKEIVEDINGAE